MRKMLPILALFAIALLLPAKVEACNPQVLFVRSCAPAVSAYSFNAFSGCGSVNAFSYGVPINSFNAFSYGARINAFNTFGSANVLSINNSRFRAANRGFVPSFSATAVGGGGQNIQINNINQRRGLFGFRR